MLSLTHSGSQWQKDRNWRQTACRAVQGFHTAAYRNKATIKDLPNKRGICLSAHFAQVSKVSETETQECKAGTLEMVSNGEQSSQGSAT